MSYLNALNPAQLGAVNHPPEIPLQILAGPGSGKTKVLTSRIAHLILKHEIPPTAICAVTFTNKAANEMKERLTSLIGKEKMVQVKMGTFHALCALFIRRYASVVGLADNFTVCDADESKKIINALLKKYKDDLESKDITLKDGTVQSLISKAKSKSLSAKRFRDEVERRLRANAQYSGFAAITDEIDLVVAEIYEDYDRTLRRNNSLDFDDLLVYGLKLFTEHKKAVKWCKHILVDEFQDTNTTQYELMRAIAVANCATIVGDPDQSIYGWRSAEVENLAKMRKDFAGTQQIFLEQNYRSTSSILKASVAIVEQDKSRIKKTLYASHPLGTTPVLQKFETEQLEAAAIASEIKRVIAYTGGLLSYGDFVILLRFNALSRLIESALQKESIPNRVLKGHKFFERLEVKDLLAYLQLMDNPQFIPAFTRIVNVPARGIGDKTLQELLSRAEKEKLSPLLIVEKIVDGRTPDIKPPVKRKLTSFVSVMRKVRRMAEEGASPAVLIRRLYDDVNYEDHLKKTQSDWESRWENVQELITFASDVDADIKAKNGLDEANTDTPLRLFLQASMLSSEGDTENGEGEKKKVTISTCHAAKGLEWPVVIIPAVEQGTFPFYRSEDIEEERRLLYVACTRAQSLLYVSHASTRKVGGDVKSRELSAFISSTAEANDSLFTEHLPTISPTERGVIAKVLDRPDVAEEDVRNSVDEYMARISRRSESSSRSNGPQEGMLPANVNFVSSSTLTLNKSTVHDSSLHRVQSVGPVDVHSGNSIQTPRPPAKKSKVGGFSRPVTESHSDCTPQLGLPPNLATSSASSTADARFRPARPAMSNSISSNQNLMPMTSSRHVLTISPKRSTFTNFAADHPPLRTTSNTSVTRQRQTVSPQAHDIPSIYISVAKPLTQPQPVKPAVHMPSPKPTSSSDSDDLPSGQVIGVKRRLGMGRVTGGYMNKRFKPPGC